jgi:hypothetical protein
MTILLRRIQENSVLKAFGWTVLVVMLGLAMGRLALDPGNARWLIAAALMLLMVALSQRMPAAVLSFLIVYLPFLGFIRRLMIPVAGWSTLDPFVVLGPAVVLWLVLRWLHHTYLQRLPIEDDTVLFRCVRWMAIVDFVQVFNPMQGSLFTGVAGIMFYTVPLGYMVLSRLYVDERRLRAILGIVFIIGILSGLYGYKQFFYGYSSFEEEWVELSGYTALKVYSLMRPISIFTSASEYAHYLAAAAAVGWVYVLRGSKAVKLIGLIGVCFIYSALFIESARGAIFSAMAAIAFMSVMNVRRFIHKCLITCAACVVLAGLFLGISKLNTDNDLIYHSVIGLTDPLGEQSTTLGHLDMMFSGFERGLLNPIGHGLGSTTIAAGKFNSMTVSSEVDLSNKFLATGIVGGLLYTFIMAKTLLLALKRAHTDAVHLTILGVLIAEGGQWLNGGHYSVAGLVWILIGYLDKKEGNRIANSLDRSFARQ